mmetsp:Transcript_75884/g.219137  ORF Transcript_75884/g.219137 Transcript_75884/m.219137 type:complete len:330 (+) Transcript_75884:1315-2304(+)
MGLPRADPLLPGAPPDHLDGLAEALDGVLHRLLELGRLGVDLPRDRHRRVLDTDRWPDLRLERRHRGVAAVAAARRLGRRGLRGTMGRGARPGLLDVPVADVVHVLAVPLLHGDHRALHEGLRRPREALDDPEGRVRRVLFHLPLPGDLRRMLHQLRARRPRPLWTGPGGVVDDRQSGERDVADDFRLHGVRKNVPGLAVLGDHLARPVPLHDDLPPLESPYRHHDGPLPQLPDERGPDGHDLARHRGFAPAPQVSPGLAPREVPGRRVQGGTTSEPLRRHHPGPGGERPALGGGGKDVATELLGHAHVPTHAGRQEHRGLALGCQGEP